MSGPVLLSSPGDPLELDPSAGPVVGSVLVDDCGAVDPLSLCASVVGLMLDMLVALPSSPDDASDCG